MSLVIKDCVDLHMCLLVTDSYISFKKFLTKAFVIVLNYVIWFILFICFFCWIWILYILSKFGFYYVINNMSKSNLRKTYLFGKQVTVNYQGESEHKIEAWTWRQKLKQRSWKGVIYYISPHGLLFLLSFTTQNCLPRDRLPTVGRALPQKSFIKKMFHRLAYKTIW